MRKTVSIPIILFVQMTVSCGQVGTEKVYHRGAVVCSERIAAETGLEILKNGGNAVDAACATAMTLAVTFPQAGNIGGGGFALVYQADSQRVYFLDFRETAPAGASVEQYLDSSGNFDSSKALFGPSAAGTPGTIAGLHELHRRFGRQGWATLVRPAQYLADTGLAVDSPLAASLAECADQLGMFDATREIFLPGGRPPRPGSRLRQTDLAATLGRIERRGTDGFYAGETADAIVTFCAQSGGLITREDLQNYRAVWRDPVHITFRGLDVYTAGLPSSGGVVMGQILKMLDYFELEKYTPGAPEYIHLFTEAARRAFADRSEYLGDPDFTDDLTDHLLDDGYILSRLKSIAPDHASPSMEIVPGMPRGRGESGQTTHLVTADEDGNIVSLTYTINASYGCKAVVPGAGFLLNNEMDDFAIMPGVANQFGLTGGGANRIEGGKRMLSSMMPTLVFDEGLPCLALGSPGGPKIITAVAQTIIKYHVFGVPLYEAVASSRFHHQWRPDTLYLERQGYDPAAIRRLKEMGHKVIERTPFGEVIALSFSKDGAFMTGAADPRRGGGYAAGY